ncbi:tyrosine-type recombinase/integrase [Halomonas sp. KRD171]|uniref:tyrosine-type recombinase/integrase n=1 Tax=Halomonas sp. KRD171 TaxID=2729726 RepID=UPI0019D1B843|nr:tyrosine-type recombinase/integrase [Halomonas sp. KRD171]
MAKTTASLTTRTLDRLTKTLPDGHEVWDTALGGYHVRSGKRGLACRLSYYNTLGQRRVLTLGRYGEITAEEARQLAKEALADIAQGKDPRAVAEQAKFDHQLQAQQTILSYLDGPYKAYQSRKKGGQATLNRLRKAFADWLDRPMGSITRADVERWQAAQESMKPSKANTKAPTKPRAFSTMKRDFGALHTLLAHASERKVIPSNPIAGIKLQKPALTEQELADAGVERRYLEPAEVDSLFLGLDMYQEEKRKQRRSTRAHGKAYLPDLDKIDYVDHVKPWILFMYYTGFRPGDIAGLRWEHINLPFKTVRKTIEKTAHHHPEPQTFPLSSSVVEVLATWHQQQGKPKSGLVFANPLTGKRFDRTAMQKPWARVRAFAKLPSGLVLYTLRHNFASQLVMAGADLLAVSKLMAHSDIQTTIQHYAHLRPDHTRDIVEAFALKVDGFRNQNLHLRDVVNAESKKININ